MKLLKSIGSKYRIIPQIKDALETAGGDLLIDVFGGSGVVVMNTGFKKRVYNDLNQDMVNFFAVLRDDELRQKFLRRFRFSPMSRADFDQLRKIYVRAGSSFRELDPIDRAVAVFYLANFSYGGKLKNGGFSVSATDRNFIKEQRTYWARLRGISEVVKFWRNTCLENLGYQDIISTYGKRSNAVLYCDPPYVGTEHYYATTIGKADHAFLAQQLTECKASAVVSYYRFEGMESLYPESIWEYRTVEAQKNCMRTGEGIKTATEYLLIKK